MRCKGFLFDLDGTLVNSLVVVERAWSNWAQAHDLAPRVVLDFIHGKQAITSLRHFLPQADEATLRQEFLALEKVEAEDTDGITAMPGAVALLNRLDALGAPWAIVTSGSVPVAHARHAKAGLPRPKTFITAEQVSRGKPEPDPYLLGAKHLALPADSCLVVEDAGAGLRSGLAAGCQVLAVHAPADLPELAQVDWVLPGLTGLQIDADEDGWFNLRHAG